MNTRKVPAVATTPESFVDALNSAFGKQTTQRAAHAKGVVLLGKFVPSAEAASVSKALHFRHEVPVTVRFSANSGIPKIADADPRAAPRGLAIKFRLPDGCDTDLVTHSYNGPEMKLFGVGIKTDLFHRVRRCERMTAIGPSRHIAVPREFGR